MINVMDPMRVTTVWFDWTGKLWSQQLKAAQAWCSVATVPQQRLFWGMQAPLNMCGLRFTSEPRRVRAGRTAARVATAKATAARR
ncbi:hypothetical protein, partial [Litorisediminicola beolgyonensis]